MKFKDYYDTLGVSKNTTDKEIERKRREKADADTGLLPVL